MKGIFLAFAVLTLSTYYSWSNTYYISNDRGNDQNEGVESSRPWKSLSRLRGLNMQGHSVLLAGGEAFAGGIEIHGLAGASAATVVGSYGEGKATIIAREGDGIVGRDVERLCISNLIV